jgi:hypothetical protein
MSWFKTWIMISFLSILYTFLHLGHIIMHLSKSINHQSNMKIVFQFSIILYKKSWSQWPTKKSCYIILSNIQIQLCSFLLEWKWVYLFFHFLFILSLVFGPIQLIHWGKENGLSSTTQKQTIRKWVHMNYELQSAKPFSFLWAIVLFCKMPFCEVNMYMKMKNNSKEQKSRNEQEWTKVKNQKQRRISKWRTKSKGE